MFRRAFAATCAAALVAAAPVAAQINHRGWPKFNGETWINKNDVPSAHHGTGKNDKLLSGHSSDTVYGHHGRDVIWGDYKPTNNSTTQHDNLFGGTARDFIYASHGFNHIEAGGGNDVVRAHFGRGYVDCGRGVDLLYLSHRSKPHYSIHHCEHITFKHGEDA
jgi:Ca2+-binding RTX toxin-like protein